jgi:hypothetical protein
VSDDGGYGGWTGQGGGEHVGDGATFKVDAAGEIHVVGELDLKVEAVDALVQTAVAAQDRLVLEQRSEAIAKVLSRLLASSLGAADTVGIAAQLVGGCAGGAVDLGEAVQADRDVRDADGLDDLDDDAALDALSGRVLLVRIVGFDVEVGDATALLREQGRREAREHTASGRRDRWRSSGRGWRGVGVGARWRRRAHGVAIAESWSIVTAGQNIWAWRIQTRLGCE